MLRLGFKVGPIAVGIAIGRADQLHNELCDTHSRPGPPAPDEIPRLDMSGCWNTEKDGASVRRRPTVCP